MKPVHSHNSDVINQNFNVGKSPVIFLIPGIFDIECIVCFNWGWLKPDIKKPGAFYYFGDQ